METSTYIPRVFNSFQGFSVKDIKEFSKSRDMEIHLVRTECQTHLCRRCGGKLGRQEGRYFVRARHLRLFDWSLQVCFWREKRYGPDCKKVRSELIEWLCPTGAKKMNERKGGEKRKVQSSERDGG